MAHQIENNEMSFVGQPAWHGLGTRVEPGSDGITMLKAAKLDWPVEARTLAMVDKLAEATPGKTRMIATNLKDYKAITRGDNQKVFNIMSNRYHVVQNLDIVNFFKEYIDAGHAEMEVVGALRGGAQIWALAKLKGGDLNLGGMDQLNARLLMMTAHDGSSPTIAKAVQERVVCANTLAIAMGEKGKEIRIRHSRKWTQELADAAKSELGIAVERVQRLNSLASQFAKIKVDGKGRIQFLQKLLNKQPESEIADVLNPNPSDAEVSAVLSKLATGDVMEKEIEALGKQGADILEAVYASPGADLVTARDTMWGLVNGVTYYVDHVRGRTADNRLSAAWFGNGATMKEDAVIFAAEMAGIKA